MSLLILLDSFSLENTFRAVLRVRLDFSVGRDFRVIYDFSKLMLVIIGYFTNIMSFMSFYWVRNEIFVRQSL